MEGRGHTRLVNARAATEGRRAPLGGPWLDHPSPHGEKFNKAPFFPAGFPLKAPGRYSIGHGARTGCIAS